MSSTGSNKKMAGGAKRLLFFHLKELQEDELQHFRSLLDQHLAADGGAKGLKMRPKNSEYMDVANLMVARYGAAQALAVTAELLSQVRQQLSGHLMQESQTYLDQRMYKKQVKAAHREKYMENLMQRWCSKEKNVVFGECLGLKDRYPKLLFLRNFSQPDGREHEILSSGKRHQEVKDQTPGTFCSEVADLFEPEKDGHIPRIVVLQGAAGIGKTRLSWKIILDWASGKLYQDKFDDVFYVHCRDIDRHHTPLSVGDLLVQSCLQMTTPTLGLLDDPRKLLFIIDGFDELRCPLLPLEAEHPPMINSQSSALGKTLLCKSSMVITTRPTAVEQLRKCVKVQHLKEILGFSQEDIEGYFHCFFGNETQGGEIFQMFQEHAVLCLCFIPIVCWIVCTVVKQRMQKGEVNICPSDTVTSVYMSFLENSLKEPSSDSMPSVQITLKRLCALAKDGIHERKIFFEEEDLSKHGLTISDIQWLFQSNVIFYKVAKDHDIYGFIHLSFQEFLAALFYVLRENGDAPECTDKPSDVTELFGDCRKLNQKHLLLTVRFVFGLLNPKAMNQMEKSFKWKISSEIKTDLLLCIKEGIKESSGKMSDNLMELLYCLYEIKDAEFVKAVLEHFQNIEINYFQQQMDRMDLTVLLFCLESSPAIQKLYISSWKMQPEQFKALVPWILESSSIQFWNSSLPAACCTELATVLNRSGALKELVLCYNEIMDSGVAELCEGLRHPGCKLRKLDMCNCSLTDLCCADLASVLSTTASLAELTLDENALGDSGASQLCEGLRHPQCKLKKLDLTKCSLTALGCVDLASALRSSPSLEELILAQNALGDSGVSQLCNGLQDPQCKLKTLDLHHCSLTGTCCEALASALSRNQSLIQLSLKNNKLGKSGIILLCEGLKHPSCRIQHLELCGCSLAGSCCADLALVLSDSSSLTELNLSHNELGDDGVTQLCQGLTHPDCRLQKLDLWLSSFTAACCADLASVLMESTNLITLKLSENKLEDSGLRQLCEGLKHPNCRLQKLELDSSSLTDGCVADLCSVLNTNQTLQSLALYGNYFTDASLTAFLQLKKDSNNLRVIWLGGNRFSAQGREELKRLSDSTE